MVSDFKAESHLGVEAVFNTDSDRNRHCPELVRLGFGFDDYGVVVFVNYFDWCSRALAFGAERLEVVPLSIELALRFEMYCSETYEKVCGDSLFPL